MSFSSWGGWEWRWSRAQNKGFRTGSACLLSLTRGDSFSSRGKWRVARAICSQGKPSPGGGVTFAKFILWCTYRTFSAPIFCPIIHPSVCTFIDRKAPNFAQIGCFLQKFAKNTPKFLNSGSFVFDENPSIAVPNFAILKSIPKGRHIYI